MSEYSTDTLDRLKLVGNSLGSERGAYQVVGLQVVDKRSGALLDYYHDGVVIQETLVKKTLDVAVPEPEAPAPVAPLPAKVTTSQRRFSYADALAMRNRRCSFVTIAEHFGVSIPSARRACKVARLERKAARKAVSK